MQVIRTLLIWSMILQVACLCCMLCCVICIWLPYFSRFLLGARSREAGNCETCVCFSIFLAKRGLNFVWSSFVHGIDGICIKTAWTSAGFFFFPIRAHVGHTLHPYRIVNYFKSQVLHASPQAVIRREQGDWPCNAFWKPRLSIAPYIWCSCSMSLVQKGWE